MPRPDSREPFEKDGVFYTAGAERLLRPQLAVMLLLMFGGAFLIYVGMDIPLAFLSAFGLLSVAAGLSFLVFRLRMHHHLASALALIRARRPSQIIHLIMVALKVPPEGHDAPTGSIIDTVSQVTDRFEEPFASSGSVRNVIIFLPHGPRLRSRIDEVCSLMKSITVALADRRIEKGFSHAPALRNALDQWEPDFTLRSAFRVVADLLWLVVGFAAAMHGFDAGPSWWVALGAAAMLLGFACVFSIAPVRHDARRIEHILTLMDRALASDLTPPDKDKDS